MTRRTLRMWSAFLAAGLLGGIGCSTTDSPSEPEPLPDQPAKTLPEPAPQAPVEPEKVTIQAADDASRQIVQDLAKGMSRDEQERVYASMRHYELALAHHNKSDFDKAKVECQRAVEMWHGNLAARKLLFDLNQLTVSGRPEFGARSLAEDEKNQFLVKIEQAQIEITKHIRDGERYFNARMYEEASKEFENADFKIAAIPYDVKAMADLQPRVKDYIVRTRNARVLEEKRKEEERQRAAYNEAVAHESAMKREIVRKIANLLELAYMAFDQKRFDRCMHLCDEILIIDPHYIVARELKEDAQKTRHKEAYYDILAKKVENWKRLTDDDEEAMIPWSSTVRFPNRLEWAEISKRITESVIRHEGAVSGDEDPEILAINRKLDTMKIDLAFDNTKLEDVLAFIRDFSQLNIVLDAALKDTVDPTKPISFKVKDLVLKNVLKLLLSQFGLDYRITEEKVVLLTDPKKAGGNNLLELHDIRDILVKLQDFAGPKVELVSPSAGGGGALTGATFTLDEPKESSVGEEQIVDLIKENIAPGTWEGEQTIEKTPNQQLLVNAPTRVHRELREFLGKLRSYTGTMVAVTCRFVAAFDDFLQDVGVDIMNRANANLGGAPGGPNGNDFPALGTTTIDEQAVGELGPGFTTNESARLESYDLRAQAFHTLLKFDPLTGIGVDPLSNRLFNQGGLGLQYQWLGEQALQIALRALHKQQKATLVQAPRITVFNTQRSHVMFLTQIAYIQDYEPQVSTLAAAYDPIIGILTHGVVLDVRPIVSNDRKYVTLELRPSLAQLQTMRTINIRPGLNILLQLPWVVLQKAETTVTVPDRGTLLITGFKDLLMRDMHSGVPFVENIPVLNFFFTRKAKADERRRLLMLVTPEIIDLAEHEDRQF